MKARLRRGLPLLVLLHSSLSANADEWKPVRLWVAGSDAAMWVVGKSSGAGTKFPVVQFWFAGKNADPSALKQNLYLPPVQGDPLTVAADAEALRVLYGDLTACDYFGNRPYSPGAVWKEQSRAAPLAWAGDADDAAFWALVRTEDLATAETPTTQEDQDEADETESAKPDSPLSLLRLQTGAWLRLPGPADAEKADAYWLAGRSGRPRLFWRTPGGILVSTFSGEHWRPPKSVTTDDSITQGWAAVSAEGAIFLAGQKAAEGRVQLRLFTEKDGVWSDLGLVREGNELLAVDPSVSGVGFVRGNVAVARCTVKGEVELGLAAIGPAPALRFATLPAGRDDLSPRPPWEEAVTLALLLGVMTIALWSRREEAVLVVALPKGFVLAAVLKRVLATFIDAAPAVVATAAWWYPKVAAFMLEYSMSPSPEQTALLETQLRSEKYATLLCYGGWCFLWEYLIGCTPGKLLFGCRVIGRDGAPPGFGQCFVRNLVRVFMVSLGVYGLLVTLMTILIVTRNRQRVGDLLARTLVVEPGLAAPPQDAAPRDDDANGPFE